MRLLARTIRAPPITFDVWPSDSSAHQRPASKANETSDLEHERAVLQRRGQRAERVVLAGVDRKELAAGPILPPEPEIAAEAVLRGAVLEKRAGEHPG